MHSTGPTWLSPVQLFMFVPLIHLLAQIIRLSFSLCNMMVKREGCQIPVLSLPEIGKQLLRFSKQVLFVCKWGLSTQPQVLRIQGVTPVKCHVPGEISASSLIVSV